MPPSHLLIRSKNFRPGQLYLLRLPPGASATPHSPRRLLHHTPCPAVVVVQDAASHRFPCERATLYSLPAGEAPPAQNG